MRRMTDQRQVDLQWPSMADGDQRHRRRAGPDASHRCNVRRLAVAVRGVRGLLDRDEGRWRVG